MQDPDSSPEPERKTNTGGGWIPFRASKTEPVRGRARRTPDGRRIVSLDTRDDSSLASFTARINEKAYGKFMRQLDECDAEEDIAIEVHSRGGDMLYTLMIANAVAQHRGRTTALVSRVALSGATVIVLACDEVVMAPAAGLGPIDLQMLLPVKCALPALDRYKDKNALCGVLHGILNDYADDYMLKLRDVLAGAYSEDEMEAVLDFFYRKHQHQTPLFPRNIKEALPFLKLTVDPDLTCSAQETPAKSNLSSLLAMM